MTSRRWRGLTGPAVLTSGRRPEVLAALWGVTLPIEHVLELPPSVINGPRYAFAAVLVLAVPARQLDAAVRTRLMRLLALLAAFALVRIVVGQIHHDPAGRMIGFVVLASVIACGPLAWRPRLHRSILLGYLLGAGASALVCLMQALGMSTLRPPGPGAHRYPGLAGNTMIFTWYVAFAVMIAVYFLVSERRGSFAWSASAIVLPLAVVGLLVSGAQGGLMGVAVGAVAFFVRCDPTSRRRILTTRVVVPAVILTAGFALVMATTNLRPSTFGDWLDGNFVNENARVDIARVGWTTFLDHPWLGVGRTQFYTEHIINPHFLPIESGASAGIVAAVLGTALLLLIWSFLLTPPAPGAYPLLGTALLAAMCSSTLTEISGPFIGVSRLMLLLVAVVAVAGVEATDQELDRPTSDPEVARVS